MATPEECIIPKNYRKYKQTTTVAVVNFHAKWGDKAANLEKIKKYTGEAVSKKVDIIIFPELALTGYEVEPERKMHKQQAETIPGPTIREVKKLAEQHKIYIVFGMPEREGKKYFNTAAIVGQKLVGKYRKVQPWIPELKWCSKGSEYPVFETEFGPIGIGICYDTYMFPEVARIYSLKGVRLYLNPTAAPFAAGWGMNEFVVQQMKARATDNLFYVAGADLVGKELEGSFVGCSIITGPKYPKISHVYAGPASETEEEMLVATLDFKSLHNMRKDIPVFEDRRPDTYGTLTKRSR